MKIGIDLGTTFSVAAYCDEQGTPHVITNRDGSNTTPSVVMFDEDEIIVGQQAKENADLDPEHVVQFVKRWMGDKNYVFETDDGREYKAEDISARILRRICDDCEKVLNEKITDAVITVPAYFSDSQRTATMDAGRIAGINVLAVINEPTAAALAYGLTQKDEQKVLVFDLGGGTFDVTLVQIKDGQFDVMGTSGNRNMGGFNFDNALMRYVAAKFKEMTNIDIDEDSEACQALRSNCEKAKIALSTRDKYRISVSANHCKPVRIDITRKEFEDLIHPLILELETNIDIVMEDKKVKPKDIDKILMVGGSTRIPCVQAFVEKKMNMKPSYELNPDEAVAIGAAIYANEFKTVPGGSKPGPGQDRKQTAQQNPSSMITDVNSHGLGVVADDEQGNKRNHIILTRNQQLPCFNERVFYTAVENQTSIKLQITEGDDDDLSYVEVIGESEMHINPHPAGSPVKVELGYDTNGIITGRVYDMVDNIYCGEAIIRREANMSEEELQSKTLRLKKESIQ